MTIKYSELNLGQIEAAVNKLGGMDGLKRFLADELVVAERQPKFAPKADPPLDTIIRVDRSVRPVYPEWVKEVMHPELEGTGPAEYDLAKVEQWLHDEQKKGVMVGNRIYEHLKSNNMLASCLGLRDLEEIQKKGVRCFPKPVKGNAVFGWKSVVLGHGGNLSVPCLVEVGGGVLLDWYWLTHDWSDERPAHRFTS
jgi:hypothetical protein